MHCLRLSFFVFAFLMLSAFCENASIKDVVYGKVQDDTVHYQVAYRTGTLRCYYKRKGSSSWTKFKEEGTYHKGYAQCPAWAKGNPKYDIKLEIVIGGMIGLQEETDEETAISNGPYPVKADTRSSVDCGCSITSPFGDCFIDPEERPPKGYKCRCSSYGFGCRGTAVKCPNPHDYGCSGCARRECCIGSCGGYP